MANATRPTLGDRSSETVEFEYTPSWPVANASGPTLGLRSSEMLSLNAPLVGRWRTPLGQLRDLDLLRFFNIYLQLQEIILESQRPGVAETYSWWILEPLYMESHMAESL